MNSSTRPTILVIVGITGDLARRKLLPAIERIAAAGELPTQTRIVGITRRDVAAKDILAKLPGRPKRSYPFVSKHLQIIQMDLKNEDDYHLLSKQLSGIEKSLGAHAQQLFYLSMPPRVSQPVIQLLGKTGFGKKPRVKLLLEKPFGSDLASAEKLVGDIQHYFSESQVYRIDHYLAKEMAQNLLVFRRGNSLFKRTWNKDFIERIDIAAAEKLGIEGRVTFYEQTGALRDLVQSHLLQLAALTLLGLPDKENWTEIRQRRSAALEALRLKKGSVVRGQYAGYRDEVGNPKSDTETFVSLTLESSDDRWKDVPITLTTGKSLNKKYTEICIHYKQEDAGEANQLKLRVQPREGIELDLWSKRPGFNREMERVQLYFDYKARADALPDAYEQVFLDAIRSDHSLFASSQEVLASWRILAPIQKAWGKGAEDLVIYEPGSKTTDVLKKSKKK